MRKGFQNEMSTVSSNEKEHLLIYLLPDYRQFFVSLPFIKANIDSNQS